MFYFEYYTNKLCRLPIMANAGKQISFCFTRNFPPYFVLGVVNELLLSVSESFRSDGDYS